MKKQIKQISTTLLAISTMVSAASAAEASLLWEYRSDPHNDSYAADGSNVYEIYGGGFAQDNQFVYFAIDSNLPITGRNTGPTVGGFPVPDRNIGWGDLFIDPPPVGTFEGGLNARTTLGIKFSPNNDSGVGAQGVYHNIIAKNVSQQNAGFWNLDSHNAAVGGRSRLGTYHPDAFFYSSLSGPGFTPSVISTGNYKGGISMIDRQGLINLGFNQLYGSQSFGVKVSKSLLPTGTFIATLLQECLNEGFAISGNITPPVTPPPVTPPVTPPPVTPPPVTPTPVPEPTTILGLVGAALIGAMKLKQRREV
jgi:hypothetical protein